MSMKQTIKSLMREKAAQGWEIQPTRGGHYRWQHVSGGFVFTSGTPSDNRMLQNVIADLRRVERAALVPGARPQMRASA